MKENSCDLSIIMVSFNTRDLTRQSLESIFKNTNGIRFEILVIDNCSSDGSAEMVEREFPRANLMRNKNNRGLATATNQGLEKSKGRYVLTLNSDTLILPGTFDKLVRFMDEHPDAGGATPKLLLPDGSLHPNFIGERPTLRSELLSVLHHSSLANRIEAWVSVARCHSSLANRIEAWISVARYGKWTDYSRTCEVPFIYWGTCFVVRREVLDGVGLQDPRFFVYYEDWDWVMRIVKKGWKLYYIAGAEIIHYGGQSTKQSSARMEAQYMKSRCRGMQKHNGLFAGLTLRAAIILLWGMKIVKLLILGTCQPSERLTAKTSIRETQEIIRAVLTY